MLSLKAFPFRTAKPQARVGGILVIVVLLWVHEGMVGSASLISSSDLTSCVIQAIETNSTPVPTSSASGWSAAGSKPGIGTSRSCKKKIVVSMAVMNGQVSS